MECSLAVPVASFGGSGSAKPQAWNHERWSSTCLGSNSFPLGENEGVVVTCITGCGVRGHALDREQSAEFVLRAAGTGARMLVTRLRVAGTPRASTNANSVPLISEGRRWLRWKMEANQWLFPYFMFFIFD